MCINKKAPQNARLHKIIEVNFISFYILKKANKMLTFS
jgi:hypothetical protein